MINHKMNYTNTPGEVGYTSGGLLKIEAGVVWMSDFDQPGSYAPLNGAEADEILEFLKDVKDGK